MSTLGDSGWFGVAWAWWALAGVSVVAAACISAWSWRSRRRTEEASARVDGTTDDAVRWRLEHLPVPKSGFDFGVADDLPTGGAARPLGRDLSVFVRQGLLLEGRESRVRAGNGVEVYSVPRGREAVVLPAGRRRTNKAAQAFVDSRLAGRAPETVRVDFRWPDEVLVDDEGRPRGYFVPALDDTFSVGGPGDAPQTQRTLAAWVVRQSEKATSTWRRDALRAVAQWTDAQHEAGIVNGQVDPEEILVSETGEVLTPLDYRHARILGSGGWLGTDGRGSFDQDRQGFARVVWSVLLPLGTDPREWLETDAEIAGFDPRQSDAVRGLLRRSSGPAGTMPTMKEWLAALGG